MRNLIEIFRNWKLNNSLKIQIKKMANKGRYPALGHRAISFLFKWEKNKYFSPYAYFFIFNSDLLKFLFFAAFLGKLLFRYLVLLKQKG